MKRATTMTEYLALVDEALVEIQDLRAAIEFDPEEMEQAIGFVERLEHQVRELRHQLAEGAYRFSDAELPFMALVARQSPHFLPFKGLLEAINRTHREGLAEPG